MPQQRFAAIGECMLEFSEQEAALFQLGFAGDTFNTAVYCRRSSLPSQVQVEYVTALGDDPYSQRMLANWQHEGVGHSCVRRIAGKLPGAYLINTDPQGERHLYYYRSQAAARFMFDGEPGDALCQELLGFNILYLSGITLAILSPQAREKLINTLVEAKRLGRWICFDDNYRPSLWSSAKEARLQIVKLHKLATHLLPSFDDAACLFGDKEPLDTARRLLKEGAEEVVVKNGSAGYVLATTTSIESVLVTPVVSIIDTTAAGDAFNGGFLAQRIIGASLQEAAVFGAKLAARVVQHKGAIIPK